MGSFANTLFMIMLGWLEAAVSAIWFSFSSKDGNPFLKWLGNSWIYIALFLCAAGIIIDLSIYLVRWRPYLVWKKLFRRRGAGREEEQESNPSDDSPAYGEAYTEKFTRRRYNPDPKPDIPVSGATAVVRSAPVDEAPDLTAWSGKEVPASSEETPPETAKIVTAAGYVVPEDSPYRRPKPKEEPEAVRPAAKPVAREEKKEIRPLAPKRRRRINVSDLFADPEEELLDIEAPQHLIDRHQAYHEPVYPSGWKKEGRGNDTSV